SRSNALMASLMAATLLDKINFCPSGLQNTRPRMNVVGVNSLSDCELGLSPMKFGRPPPSGSKPSGRSRAIARQRLPRDRAAYGVSSHSGNARYRGARGTVDDAPSSVATAVSTSRAAQALATFTPLLARI